MTSRGSAGRLVDHSPVTDVGLLVALLPLWWVLGMEQFIWPLGFGLIAIRVLLRNGTFLAVGPLKWGLAFVAVHAVSLLFIVESYRMITFGRNLGAYVAMLFLIFVITNCVEEWRHVRFLLGCLVAALTVSAVLGLVGLLSGIPLRFTSLMGHLMPHSVAATDYGGNIARRSTGHYAWFILTGDYFRVTGLFMYATLYASVIVVTLPVAFFLTGVARRTAAKIGLGLIVVVLLANLAGTTARVAAISFLVGAAYFLLFASERRILYRAGAVTALIGALLLGVITYEEWRREAQIVEAVVLARGTGSYDHRTAVYRETLAGFTERPFFGWGTERDIRGLRYPAGSHSHYLGILYKQGLVGFLLFLGLWASLWRSTRPIRDPPTDEPDLEEIGRFLRYGRWALVAVLVNATTDVLDLDATTFVFMWVIFACLIAARRIHDERTILAPV
jgi:hypothetical protein